MRVMEKTGKSSRMIRVSRLADHSELVVPVLEMTAGRSGPRVGITATIHGDETVGVQILRQLWESLDPTEVRGCLWLVPVANPPAFQALSRNTPIDMLDLNRAFPGSRTGWLSEQLAYCLTEEFLNHLDYYVDIHAGGTFPVVDYCYCLNDVGLARSFLSPLLYKPEQLYAGTTATVTVARGTPTLVVELGGGYLNQAQHVDRGFHSLINVLRYAGALTGDPGPPPDQTLLREIRVIRPCNGGLCLPEAHSPGDVIDGIRKLADILSPYTFETIETLETPFNENIVVLARQYATRINAGDYAYMIGNLSTAERLTGATA